MSEQMNYELQLDSNQLAKQTVNGIRVALGVVGVVALGLGAFLLLAPEKTAVVAAVIFGLYFVVAGVVRLASGVLSRGIPGGLRVLNIVLGLLVLVAGVLILRNPAIGVITLGLLVGLAWIIDGIAAIVFRGNDRSGGFGVLFGALSIIAGIVVLFVPEAAISVLIMVGGIFLAIAGIVALVQAFAFGRAAKA